MLARESRGSILLVALFVTGILGFVVGSYLRTSLNSLRRADLHFYTQNAANLAEAGAETALLAVNNNDFTDWSTRGSMSLKKLPSFDLGNGISGSVKVRVDSSGQNPQVISESSIVLKNGDEIRKQVEVNLRPRSLFANGLTVKSNLYFYYGGNVAIDSYNSSKGNYHPFLNRSDEGNVAANKTSSKNGTTANIYGKMISGSTPDVGSNGRVYGQSTPFWEKIDEERVSGEFTFSSEDAVPPYIAETTYLPNDSTITVGSHGTKTQIRVPGDVYIRSSQKLRIRGDVTMVVDDDFWMYGELEIDKKESALKLYVKDDIRFQGTGVRNRSEKPENFIIMSTATYGTPNYQMGGDNPIHAAVYAPRGYLDLMGKSYGDGTMYGAMLSKNVRFRGPYDFHIDNNLQKLKPDNPTYTVDSWRRLEPGEFVTISIN